MPRLSSSAVDRVDYTPSTRTLDIWYVGGDRYSYLGVPPEIYRALLDADSAGAFVNERIKPHYPFEPNRRRRFRPD